MPISLERVAEQFIRERAMRAVLEAWLSTVLLRGRVERRWMTWTEFNGHLLRACVRFWHTPWDEDTRAAFDAWRSSMILSKSIHVHPFVWRIATRKLLLACIRAWMGDRRHGPRIVPRFLRTWAKDFGISRRVFYPRVVNPNEIAPFMLDGDPLPAHLKVVISKLVGQHKVGWTAAEHLGSCGQSCMCCRAANAEDWPSACIICVDRWHLMAASRTWAAALCGVCDGALDGALTLN